MINPGQSQSGNAVVRGSRIQKLAMPAMARTDVAVIPAEYDKRVAEFAAGMTFDICVVSTAAVTPIALPPMFMAKLSPVPRRWVGKILGK